MPAFNNGDVIAANFLNAIPRENCEQELCSFPIPVQTWRYNTGDIVNSTGGSGKPKIVFGGHSQPWIYLQGQDAHGTTKTEYANLQFVLPESYVAGSAIQLIFSARVYDSDAGVITTKYHNVNAFVIAQNGTVNAANDLCTDSPKSLTLAMAEYTWNINSTNLLPGDQVCISVTAVVTESGGTGAQKIEFGGATIKAYCKG